MKFHLFLVACMFLLVSCTNEQVTAWNKSVEEHQRAMAEEKIRKNENYYKKKSDEVYFVQSRKNPKICYAMLKNQFKTANGSGGTEHVDILTFSVVDCNLISESIE